LRLLIIINIIVFNLFIMKDEKLDKGDRMAKELADRVELMTEGFNTQYMRLQRVLERYQVLEEV